MSEKFVNKRKSLGLTQREIAAAVGVTVQTVSNWETGLYQPKLTLPQTLKLSQILQTDLSDLVEIFKPLDLEVENSS